MNISRRQALKLFGTAVPALATHSALAQSAINVTPGKFTNTRESPEVIRHSRVVWRCEVWHMVALGTGVVH
jgi:hypothetical protein